MHRTGHVKDVTTNGACQERVNCVPAKDLSISDRIAVIEQTLHRTRRTLGQVDERLLSSQTTGYGEKDESEPADLSSRLTECVDLASAVEQLARSIDHKIGGGDRPQSIN